MDWNITATSSAIRHLPGANNASIKPMASQIRVNYNALNECGCSANRFHDFNVVSGESLRPSISHDPILVPIDDGGIIEPENGPSDQFIPTGNNN